MSRFILIRRLRGPALLLLIGVLALLRQAGVIDRFWHLFWPLLLILLGVFLLAERAALAADGGYPPYPPPGSYPGAPYPGAPYSGGVNPAASTGAPQYPGQPATAIVPALSHDFQKNPDGDQS